MKMWNADKQGTSNQPQRILARRLARELTKEELAGIAGGHNSSSAWSSSSTGGDDGGADD